MDTTNHNKEKITTSGRSLSLPDLLHLYRKNWRWFLLSIFITTSLAVLYLVKKQPVFLRSAEVLVKEENGGMPSVGGDLGAMAADLGLFSSSSSVYNEMFAMKSPYVMDEVVRRLHLDMAYIKQGFIKEKLYGKTRPVTIVMER